MNKVIIAVSFALMKSIFAASFTQRESAYIRSNKTITACVDPAWMPIEKIDSKTNRHQGIAGDYLNLLSTITGMQIKTLNSNSWKESVEAAKNRKCDLFSAVAETSQRKEYMNFLKPYLKLKIGLVGSSQKSFVRDLDDVMNSSLAIVNGYAAHDILKKQYPNKTFVLVRNTQDGLEKIMTGEIDYLIDYISSASYYIRQQALFNVKITGVTDLTLDLGIAVRNDRPILNEILRKANNSVSSSAINALFQKWVNIEVKENIYTSSVIKILVLPLLAILYVLFSNRKLKNEASKRKKAEERADNANKAKGKFLANMSHELRTPLNGVIGSLNLLKNQNCDLSEQDILLNTALLSGQQMLAVINDVLDLSKIESGSFEFEKIEFNILERVNIVEKMFSEACKEKSLSFVTNVDPKLNQSFPGDPHKFAQILINLLSNAIKFTNNGSVTLTLSLKGSNLTIQVIDTGIGIHKDNVPGIFDAFKQEDTSTTRVFGGTGLGLAITKRIIEMQDGKIRVESMQGIGTRFVVDLSMEPIHDVFIPTNTPQTQKQKKFLTPLNLKILLVEDAHINQKIFQMMAHKLSCHCTVAENGQIALDILKKESFDVVCMDWRMPVMDGIEATKHIRKNDLKLPIIGMTANSFEEDRIVCMEAGMNSFLSKPFILEQLQHELEIIYGDMNNAQVDRVKKIA